MPYIELNNVKIFYILHKNSKNYGEKYIILIHGTGGNHLSMLSIFNYIKKKFGGTYNILVPDLPFHFRSVPENSSGFNSLVNSLIPVNDGIAFYAQTINTLASKLFKKNRDVILIGHSMGAQISIKYASLFPESIGKIMLIAGCLNTYISDSFIKSLENSFDRTIMLFLKDALGSRDKNILNNAFADIKRTPPQTVINDFKYSKYYSGHYDRDIDKINRSKIFFNIIYSKKDLIITYKCIKELYEKLKNSRVNEIPAQNHIDFLYENYLIEKEIDKFLLT